MASAYVALLSLNSSINEQNQGTFDLESFKLLSAFLLQFFEDYHNSRISPEEILNLEIRTKDVALELSCLIDTLAMDQMLIKYGYSGKSISEIETHATIDRVSKEFASIKEESIKVMINIKQNQLPITSFKFTFGPSESAQTCADNSTMVGFHQHMLAVMELIIDYDSTLKILPIVGMGGIGKTTLALNVFDKKLVKEHFQIRLWSTISQSYKVQDIISHFLHDLNIVNDVLSTSLHSLMIVDDQISPGHLSSIRNPSQPNEKELADKLYKTLFGRRYLIVLDDIWSVELWDSIGRFFPKNDNGSRIIITTRLRSVASYIGSCDPYKLEYLDEDESWNLLERKLFAQEGCPSMLGDVGRRIAVSCRGLPLAIVVIAGHLAKSDMTKESWENVEGSLISILVSRNDSPCLDILSLSYDNLPIHLKPCFLYLGLCGEQFEFRVTEQVKLWIANGILKPMTGKCLEDTAMQYLIELVGRNLISVSKRGSSGKIKSFRIHDLLRDLCIRKAHEHQFLYWEEVFHMNHSTLGTETKCNINKCCTIKSDTVSCMGALIRRQAHNYDFSVWHDGTPSDLWKFRSRHITFSSSQVMRSRISAFLAQVFKFQNLQSLDIQETPENDPVILPPEIWDTALLRNLDIKQSAVLPDPPTAGTHVIGNERCVLKNMQTLQDVHCFKLSEEVVRRIPNLKKLKMTYTKATNSTVEWGHYCLHNLARLCKLESLRLSVSELISPADISFSQSLKKLTLHGCNLPWGEITMVGSLPNLEVLRLQNDAFYGREWRSIEGEFCRLKELQLRNLSTLGTWEADSSHFPRLERLIIYNVWRLKRIPENIADIATLQFVSFENCNISLMFSMQEQIVEQKGMGNDSIQFDYTSCSIIDGGHLLILKLLYSTHPIYDFARMMDDYMDKVRDLYAFLRYTATRKQGNEAQALKFKELSKDIQDVFYEHAEVLLAVLNLRHTRRESINMNYNLRRFLCVVKEVEYLSVRVQRIFLADGDYHHHHQELTLYKDSTRDYLEWNKTYRDWHITIRHMMVRDPDLLKKEPHWGKYLEPPVSNSRLHHKMFRDFTLLTSIDGPSEETEMNSSAHFGIVCDYCHKNPIVGVRYKCKDCTENGGFDLCEECYSSGLVSDVHPGLYNNRKHTSEHKFEIMK